MGKAAERYKRNQELLKGWLASHLEHKELVSVLQKVTEIYTNRKAARKSGEEVTEEVTEEVKLSVSIGQAVSENNFSAYLTSYIDNPKVIFSSLVGKPYFIIMDDGYGVAAITFEDIRNIQTDKETDASCDFDRWCFRFSLEEKFDYEISVTIYK